MKEIQHIFFDLDHTLWDYDRSAQETLSEIHRMMELDELVELTRFVDTFYSVNNELWHKYNQGQIDRQYIKENRFSEIFNEVGLVDLEAVEASEYFLQNCALKPHLMPSTKEVLNYLKPKYKLHIITNGFKDVQPKKLSSSGIHDYFEEIVTSECSNSRKPSPEIFEYALNKVNAETHESVMIGDNPKTDIHGARDFGMKTVLYDPSGNKRSMADISIQSLEELIRIF